MCVMGLHLEMSIISIFEVQAERESVKERRLTRKKGKEMTTSAEKEQNTRKVKERVEATKSNDTRDVEKLRCRSNNANLSRGGEVKVEEWMAMKNNINIAQSQARLQFENGLQFVHQYFCQAICLSPSGKLRTTQTLIFRKGK